MKKLIFFLLLFVLFPIHVFSINNYDVEAVFIDTTILENGNLKVKEFIAINGSFTGYKKNIKYKDSRIEPHETFDFKKDTFYNATSLKNIVVKYMKIDDEYDFSILDEPMDVLERIYYEEDARNKEYVESSFRDGKTIKIFYQGDYETVGFYIEYEVLNAVVVHEDIAEIYWNFIDEDFKDAIEVLKIRVHLPKEEDSMYFKTFIHGDITGKSVKIGNGVMESTIKRVNKNATIDLRVTFPKEMISEVVKEKRTTEVAFQKILELEESHVIRENNIKRQEEKNERLMIFLCSFYTGCLFIWWIFVFFKFDKEYTPQFNKKYQSDITSKYSITKVEYLMTHSVTEKTFVATLFSLVERKNIRVTETNDEVYFELLHTDSLNKEEELLVEFLFNTINNDKKISLSEFRDYGSDKNTYKKFHNAYCNFLNCVFNESSKMDFYESHGLPIVTGIFAVLIGIFLLFANMYFTDRVELSIAYLSSGLFCLYTYFIKKKSRNGNEEYHKWIAFQNYLMDYEKLSHSVSGNENWKEFYNYAIILSCEKEIKALIDTMDDVLEYQKMCALKKEFIEIILKNKKEYEKQK